MNLPLFLSGLFTKLTLINLFVWGICIHLEADTSRLDSLLYQLDQTIDEAPVYEQQKDEYINSLKKQLYTEHITDQNKYYIYSNLAKEYELYISDSSKAYAVKALAIARQNNNRDWIVDSQLQQARIETKAGMFTTALELLSSIEAGRLTREQQISYYNIYLEYYVYLIEYQEGENQQQLVSARLNYRDSLLFLLHPNTFKYVTNYGSKYIEANEIDKAEKILLSFYGKLEENTQHYAIYTSFLAWLYQRKGERDIQMEYLARSAIADIQAGVKENVSLRTLALELFNDGDIHRANKYIKKSMEDANFYNARLRNIQISKLLPAIDHAYQVIREEQQQKLRLLLITVSILTLILLVAMWLLFRQMRKIARAKDEIMHINSLLKELNTSLQEANEQKQQTNHSLAEANLIKEQFIGNFLSLCTDYIEKLENFKVTVNRKIKVGQTSDILKMTSSSEKSAQELKELYYNFDKAFLAIYPGFVEAFNELLREEERYPLTSATTLNQELRVFALIRLGITDSNKIATFLHYSLRTIYNYRSKVKAKAKNPDIDFEEQVKKIGG